MLISNIQRMIAALTSKDDLALYNFEVEYSDYDSKTLLYLVEDLEASYGFVLDQEEAEILCLNPGSSIGWSAKEEEAETFGGFHYIGIPAAIGAKYKVKLYHDDIENPEKGLITNAGYFDVMPGLEYQVATVVILNETSKKLELWYMDHFQMTKIECTIREYVEALALTKGMYHWQYLYCHPNCRTKLDFRTRSYINQIIPYLQKAFPAVHYNDLIKRHQQLIHPDIG